MPFFNETLWILFLIFDMSVVLFVYYFWGKIGLFACIVLSLVVANIQVVKLIDLFGLTTTLGNILYASVFLATDMISEMYSKKEAQKAVFLGFTALVLTTIYLQISLLYIPAPSDIAQESLETIFGFLPRIALASLCAYLVSQTIDVWIYHTVYKITNTKHLWLRNTVSTLSSQLLDTIIFTLIAFLGLYPSAVIVEIALTTYLFKAIVAFVDTPFMYLARIIHNKRYALEQMPSNN